MYIWPCMHELLGFPYDLLQIFKLADSRAPTSLHQVLDLHSSQLSGQVNSSSGTPRTARSYGCACTALRWQLDSPFKSTVWF